MGHVETRPDPGYASLYRLKKEPEPVPEGNGVVPLGKGDIPPRNGGHSTVAPEEDKEKKTKEHNKEKNTPLTPQRGEGGGTSLEKEQTEEELTSEEFPADSPDAADSSTREAPLSEFEEILPEYFADWRAESRGVRLSADKLAEMWRTVYKDVTGYARSDETNKKTLEKIAETLAEYKVSVDEIRAMLRLHIESEDSFVQNHGHNLMSFSYRMAGYWEETRDTRRTAEATDDEVNTKWLAWMALQHGRDCQRRLGDSPDKSLQQEITYIENHGERPMGMLDMLRRIDETLGITREQRTRELAELIHRRTGDRSALNTVETAIADGRAFDGEDNNIHAKVFVAGRKWFREGRLC